MSAGAGCAGCAGQCCRTYKVAITASDMQRLASGTALPPSEFVTLLEHRSGFRLEPGGPTLDLYLQRRSGGQGCVFLMEIAKGHARCGAYAHRPLVCSNFPLALEGGTVAARQDTVCGPDSWNLAAMDLVGYRGDLLRSRAAWSDHFALIERWNRKVDAGGRKKSPRQLYDYLMRQETAWSRERDTAEKIPGP